MTTDLQIGVLFCSLEFILHMRKFYWSTNRFSGPSGQPYKMSTSEDTGAEVGGVEAVKDGSSKTEPEVKDEGEKVDPKDELEQETVKDVNDRVEEPAEMREGRGTVTVEVKEVWKEEPTETEDQLDDGLPAEIR